MSKSIESARAAIEPFKPLFDYGQMVLTAWGFAAVAAVLWKVQLPLDGPFVDGWFFPTLKYVAVAWAALLAGCCFVAIYRLNNRLFVVMHKADDIRVPRVVRIVVVILGSISVGSFPAFVLFALTSGQI